LFCWGLIFFFLFFLPPQQQRKKDRGDFRCKENTGKRRESRGSTWAVW
jgi:hypothetical protein